MTRSSSFLLRAVLFLGLCAVLLVWWMPWMWSSSADLALHYELTAGLAELWSVPPTLDVSLGSGLSSYPRLSHTLAALVGSLFNSSLIGIQLVTLVSLIVLWSAIVHLLLSLPRASAVISSTLLVACLVLNRAFVHLELCGNEVISNFFFPQLVAQALALLAILILLYAEQCGAKPLTRYLVLGACVPVIARTHLVPAVVLLGFLAALVVLEVALESRSTTLFRTVSNATVGVLLTGGATAMVILDPSFRLMREVANYEGSLPLAYISGMKGLALLCLVVLIGSSGILLKWIRLDGHSQRTRFAVMKYVALYGISLAGLCLLQMIALKLGHGSEYAARKYVFGLNTAALLDIALLPLLRTTLGSGVEEEDRWGLLRCSLPVLLILVALLCIVPSAKVIDTQKAVSLERQITSLRDTVIPRVTGKYDYAVNLQDGSPTVDFMMSIGVLRAPYLEANSMDILRGRPLSRLASVGTIVTSEHGVPYDIEACRRFVSRSGIVLLDGSCVAKSLNPNGVCKGTINFTDSLSPETIQGFSSSDAWGRWTDGKEASFTCSLPEGRERPPSTVLISTTGYVSLGHPQRLFISINGSKAAVERYDSADPNNVRRVIELQLPRSPGKKLTIKFSVPDAVSPKELGLSPDARKVAINVGFIQFK
jgi:hypothetical protein